MPTYAIGDIQGCFDSLRRLLDLCRFDPSRDRLWLVGDLVNRGPHSLETLRFVKQLGNAALAVLGNHDLYLLMAAEGFGKPGKEDTLGPVLAAPDRDELLAWLRGRPLCHHEDGYFLVHAGLLPQWSAAQARRLGREVEVLLAGEHYRELLANMWGSQPLAWKESLSEWDRMRVIVNAMTRMRFCSAEGTMELRTKGGTANTPLGYMPWFDVPGRKSSDTVLVTGHWSALGLRIRADLLALDSGCLWGRHLTAVRLPDHKVFQVDCAGGETVLSTD
ncbi:MAG: symmetrical bis(5'-nucleosyl)-tetraphosphatase [Rhodocyclaceae bacterium]